MPAQRSKLQAGSHMSCVMSAGRCELPTGICVNPAVRCGMPSGICVMSAGRCELSVGNIQYKLANMPADSILFYNVFMYVPPSSFSKINTFLL